MKYSSIEIKATEQLCQEGMLCLVPLDDCDNRLVIRVETHSLARPVRPPHSSSEHDWNQFLSSNSLAAIPMLSQVGGHCSWNHLFRSASYAPQPNDPEASEYI